ncbi:TonB-dependent receptor [uncultured Mucilaginibacter sp.]|uniref:SusC/RagA family TonB-linked outer membrane protein n=1 Tax=uncultured Mucilaginibacter sp. TaxID=797541 RepID=UPI0025D012B3|nr:TonB-dependent receptor [uncultured Mucilaginibacter sp.]
MRKKITLFILLLLFAGSQLFAQSLKIAGKVTDRSGLPLPGVTVKVKGTTTAVSTDAAGKFTISAAANSVLSFSFIGYTGQDIAVNNHTTINVVLQDDIRTLNDVVVVGYGSQKSEKVSGAISTIKSSDVEKVNAVRVEDAIQGRVSGVEIIQSGSPGVTPTVLIRGIPSYTGSDPLVVIDGVEQTLTDFNSLNPTDVESVSILKDAAATAIYGVNGGNGVILVTTKTGKKDQKTQFRLSTSYGIQQVANKVDVLNATQFAAMENEASTLSGGPLIFPNLSTVGVGTNWQDQIFKNAPLQNYTLSATGGTSKTTYFLEAGYTDQAGIVGGIDKSDYGRGNFTANLNFDLTPKLRFTINATDVILNSKGVAENSFNSVIGNALNFDPTVPVYNNVPNTVGTYGFSRLELQEVHNPLTQLDNTYNKDLGNKLYGKFELQYDVVKNIKLTSRFGYTDYNDNAKSFNPLIFYGLNNSDNTMNADGSTVTGDHNSVTSVRNGNFNWNWESYANYDFSYKTDHHFQAVAGITFAEITGNQIGVSRQDVPFNSWTYADYTAATGVNSATNTNAQTGYYYQYSDKKLSYFARLNYDYKDKYLATFSDREDGDQVFGANNKFGNFYAASLGWIVSKEDFFQSKLVTFLKLRGSYGISGNSNASNAQVSTIVTGGPYNTIGNSNGYSFGNMFEPGSSIGSLANPDLAWEKDKQTDIGFDIELAHKLTFNFDLYKKDVDGLLFTPTQSLYLGTVPASNANIGSTSTKGIDAMVSYNTNFGKNFKFSTSLTFSTFKSNVTATNSDNSAIVTGGSFYNGQSQTATVFKTGYAPGEFWGYKTDGLFQTQAQITQSPAQAGAQPGSIKYVDVNGDGVITSADQTDLGSPFPKFTMGWNLNLAYKQFDLTTFVYISEGNKIFKAWDRNANYTNKPSTILARWTGPGSTNDAANPEYTFTDVSDNSRVSDRYIEDGSFIKIKNIQLGYTIPKSILKGQNTSLRIYAQVKNAYTFTKYTGFDPEISGGIMNSGVDYGNYPQARIGLVGLDFKF